MITQWLGWVDLLLLLVVLISALGGSQQGVFQQVPELLGLSAFGALLFTVYPVLFRQLVASFPKLNETLIIWLLLLGVLIFSLGSFVLIESVFQKIAPKRTHNKDVIEGFLCGMFRGGLVAFLALLVLFLIGTKFIKQVLYENSVAGHFVSKICLPQVQPARDGKTLEDEFRSFHNPLLGERPEAGKLE
jgi:uncharacterized membrane protein required for colicin V production